MATVTVAGTADREVEPDRVRVTLGLEMVAADVRPAVDELAQRSAVLDAVLDDLGDDVLARRPSSLQVRPRYRYGGPEPVLEGQAASRTVVVELRAGGSIGSVLARVAIELGVRVLGTDWLVDPDNAVYGELRGAAVADAHGRAAAYAEAAGLGLGALEWIAEPGLAPDGPHESLTQRFTRALSAQDHGGADDQPLVLELRPEAIRVASSIHAAYALLEA